MVYSVQKVMKKGVKSLIFTETTYIVGYVFWDTRKSIRSKKRLMQEIFQYNNQLLYISTIIPISFEISSFKQKEVKSLLDGR